MLASLGERIAGEEAADSGSGAFTNACLAAVFRFFRGGTIAKSDAFCLAIREATKPARRGSSGFAWQ